MKRNKKKKKRAFVNLRESPFLFQPLFVLVGMTDAIAAEQDGDAPDSCQAHDRIDDARYDGAHAAENAGDEIELEQADHTPVQRADDDENKRKCIHGVFLLLFRDVNSLRSKTRCYAEIWKRIYALKYR